jgi:hypothetical protein
MWEAQSMLPSAEKQNSDFTFKFQVCKTEFKSPVIPKKKKKKKKIPRLVGLGV